jgi:hypothetical protein
MVHKSKNLIFHFYRYQILPTSKQIQLTFAPYKIKSLSELLKKKNELFEKALLEIKIFESPRTELEHKLIDQKNNIFIFKIGANRGIKRTKRDFTEEKMENWPNCLVAINNDNKIQKIAVQQNSYVFWDTQMVTNILERNLNKKLNAYQLSVVIEPMFEEKVFWDIVKNNKNRILAVDFELVTPNLANISSSLSDELKVLQKSTNTQKTNVKLHSDKGSALEISSENSLVKDLVSYAARGGGNIRCKIRGYKKYINTRKNVKQETIDEIQIEHMNSENAGEIIKELSDKELLS